MIKQNIILYRFITNHIKKEYKEDNPKFPNDDWMKVFQDFRSKVAHY